MKSDQAGRIEWLDTLRAMSALLVILLHAAAPYVLSLEPGTSGWGQANWIDSFARSCVPLFFMMSGYLFLGSRAPSGKHLGRILAALTFYSLIALPIALMLDGGAQKALNILTQPVFYHLWFFYSIPAIYMLAMLVKVREPKDWKNLLPLFGLLIVLNPTTFDTVLGIGSAEGPAFLTGMAIFYMLYAVAGAHLGRIELPKDKRIIVALRIGLPILIAVCVASVAILTERSSVAAGEFVSTFYKYDHALNAISALSIFLWIRLGRRPDWATRVSRALSKRSLAIYGLHAPILLCVIQAFKPVEMPTYVEIFGLFIATLSLSYLAAEVIGRLDRRGWIS